MGVVTIRPAKKEDLIAVAKDNNYFPVRAWAAEYNGELACVAGVELAPKQAVAFSGIVEELDAPKMTIWKGALELFDKIKSLDIPVLVAYADNRHLNSRRFLEKLGFSYAGSINNKEVMVWRRPH